jgi:outer membrane protein
MSRRFVLSLLAASSLATGALVADANYGIVNFANCVADSKLGKQEQASFETIRKQMSTLVEDTNKQMQEIATKLNDQEYLDGLSPDAEKELQNKYEALAQDMQRYQNQYYQVMNQANMNVMQALGSSVSEASEKVAKNKKLSMVVSKDACFFYANGLDVTADVVAEMDKMYAAKAENDSHAKADLKADAKAEAKK